jgi:hypothetical protein
MRSIAVTRFVAAALLLFQLPESRASDLSATARTFVSRLNGDEQKRLKEATQRLEPILRDLSERRDRAAITLAKIDASGALNPFQLGDLNGVGALEKLVHQALDEQQALLRVFAETPKKMLAELGNPSDQTAAAIAYHALQTCPINSYLLNAQVTVLYLETLLDLTKFYREAWGKWTGSSTGDIYFQRLENNRKYERFQTRLEVLGAKRRYLEDFTTASTRSSKQ